MRIPLYHLVIFPVARALRLPPIVVQFFMLGAGFGIAAVVKPTNATDPLFWWLAMGATVGIPLLSILIDRDVLNIPDKG